MKPEDFAGGEPANEPASGAPAPAAPAGGDPGAGGSGAEPKGPSTLLEAITQGLDGSAEPATDKALDDEQPAPGSEPKAPTEEELEAEVKPPANMGPEQAQAFAKQRGQIKHWRGKFEKASAEAQQHGETISSFRQLMEESGMDRDRLMQATAYTSMLRAGDFDSAAKVLLEQLQQISLLAGKQYGVEAADPLSAFPDLREAVDRLDITQDHALELARARHSEKQRTQQQQKQQQGQQQQSAAMEAQRAAAAEIKKWTDGLIKTDIDFAAKEDMLVKKGEDGKSTFDWIKENFPPEKWLAALQREYARAVPVKKPAPGGARPMGGAGPAAGGGAEPKNMFEAIKSGLATMKQ